MIEAEKNCCNASVLLEIIMRMMQNHIELNLDGSRYNINISIPNEKKSLKEIINGQYPFLESFADLKFVKPDGTFLDDVTIEQLAKLIHQNQQIRIITNIKITVSLQDLNGDVFPVELDAAHPDLKAAAIEQHPKKLGQPNFWAVSNDKGLKVPTLNLFNDFINGYCDPNSEILLVWCNDLEDSLENQDYKSAPYFPPLSPGRLNPDIVFDRFLGENTFVFELKKPGIACSISVSVPADRNTDIDECGPLYETAIKRGGILVYDAHPDYEDVCCHEDAYDVINSVNAVFNYLEENQ